MSDPTANAVPIWELVLKKCWTTDCPKIATARDWAGWWFCDDHRDRLQDGRADVKVTWESATELIRQALDHAPAGTGDAGRE